MKKIGTKLYYCLLTGNVLQLVGDMAGNVIEPTFEQDYEVYNNLKERDKSTIGLLKFEYGEYPKLSENSTGVSIDLETKQPIFNYEPLPEVPYEPSRVDILENKISALEAENKSLKIEQDQQNEEILVNMLANTEMFEMILGEQPMTLSIEKNIKNTGGSMGICDVYVTLIIKGIKAVEDVPLAIKEKVIERLKQLEVPVK